MKILSRVLLAVLLLGGGLVACSDDDDDDDITTRSYFGTAFFGIGQQPQPITIVIIGDDEVFGGSVTTDNVPDGNIFDGRWSGNQAVWNTREGGVTVTWEATRSGRQLDGFVREVELSFQTEEQ